MKNPQYLNCYSDSVISVYIINTRVLTIVDLITYCLKKYLYVATT